MNDTLEQQNANDARTAKKLLAMSAASAITLVWLGGWWAIPLVVSLFLASATCGLTLEMRSRRMKDAETLRSARLLPAANPTQDKGA